MIGKTCVLCGRIHSNADAIATTRFSSITKYRSILDGDAPPRSTRSEAVQDTCNYRRIQRVQTYEKKAEKAPIRVKEPSNPTQMSFPQTGYEKLAREQAWSRFLAEALFSLQIWKIEPLTNLESPVQWLRRCKTELDSLVKERNEHRRPGSPRGTRSPQRRHLMNDLPPAMFELPAQPCGFTWHAPHVSTHASHQCVLTTADPHACHECRCGLNTHTQPEVTQ